MRNVREDPGECPRARQCFTNNRLVVHGVCRFAKLTLHTLSGEPHHALSTELLRPRRAVFDRHTRTHGKSIRRRRAELVHFVYLHRHRLCLALLCQFVKDCCADSLDAHTVIDVWRIIHAKLTAHRPDLAHAGTLLGDGRLTCRLRIRLHARIQLHRHWILRLDTIFLVLLVHVSISILNITTSNSYRRIGGYGHNRNLVWRPSRRDLTRPRKPPVAALGSRLNALPHVDCIAYGYASQRSRTHFLINALALFVLVKLDRGAQLAHHLIQPNIKHAPDHTVTVMVEEDNTDLLQSAEVNCLRIVR